MCLARVARVFRRHRIAAVCKLWLGACTFFLVGFFFFFFLPHADALVRVWVRDQTHLWSGFGGAEDAGTRRARGDPLAC